MCLKGLTSYSYVEHAKKRWCEELRLIGKREVMIKDKLGDVGEHGGRRLSVQWVGVSK